MYFALLDNNLGDYASSYLFRNPLKFITCTDSSLIIESLEEIDREVNKGNYACGYICYEASQAFTLKTRYNFDENAPILCFGIFSKRETIDARQADNFLKEQGCTTEGHLIDVRSDTTQEEYYKSIHSIHHELALGNTYQVNYTTRHYGRIGGSVSSLYSRLRKSQKVEYGAYLKFPYQYILSRSPELFFKKIANKITTKPMKGTAERFMTNLERDQKSANLLRSDVKQRAENLMIVDLLRNDLGQIAEAGSVKVEKLFEVETFETIHQMTSTISCLVDEKKYSLTELMKALFPCGSITGAPKKSTCEIIAALESSPRGVYTGAIGMVEPNKNMCFNVAIRTLSIDSKRNFSFGVGGGIVIDSSPAVEFAECQTKARFLFDKQPELKLIEAVRWSQNEGFINLKAHLSRLSNACSALGFPPLPADMTPKMQEMISGLTRDQKLRIEYSRSGDVHLETSDLVPLTSKEKTTLLSPRRLSNSDFLRKYKTTNRVLFDQERRYYHDLFGIYDVLFANENEYLTEASYHNLFLRFGTDFHTPALEAGLLDGVGRALFIKKNTDCVIERQIPVKDLYEADEVFLVSSVRGCHSVKVLQDI